MKQLNWYQIFGNVHTIPEGSTVTPTDDVQILLHCANIWDKSYTTIGEVIADDDTLFLTLIDNNAIDYLVRSTTFASSIVASESAMQYIGASDYASETLLSDSTWLTAIDGSAYKDYVINASVPTMTSNTTPEGECISSGANGSDYNYKAFDGNANTLFDSSTVSSGSGSYIGYTFPSTTKIYLAECIHGVNTDQSTTVNLKYQSKTSDGDWTDVSDSFDVAVNNNTPSTSIIINGGANDVSYRLYKNSANRSTRLRVFSLQFSGRRPAGVQTWLKAGGITNKKYTTVSEVLSDLTTLAALMASSDAVDYLVTAKGWATEICSDSNAMADIGMNNYCANTLLADETWREAILNSTYIDSVMNVKVPVMTDNTHPYGVASQYGNPYTGYDAYKAFDGDESTSAQARFSTGETGYVRYEFPSAVKCYAAHYIAINPSGSSVTFSFKVQRSADGSTWTDISGDWVVKALSAGGRYDSGIVIFPSFESVKYYQMIAYPSSYYAAGAVELQFYGRKDI